MGVTLRVLCALGLATFVGAAPAVESSPTATPMTTPSAVPSAQVQVFTPPDGWSEVPSYFLITPVVWQSADGRDTMMLARTPFAMSSLFSTPGMGQAMRTAIPKMLKSLLGAGVAAASHMSTATVALCGSPATVLTMHVPKGQTEEMILEGAAGSGLIIVYSYSGAETESHFLHTLCPVASADITTLAPPAGWRVKASMHQVASWFGPTMGEMLTESQGPVMPNLDAALRLVSSPRGSGTIRTGTASFTVKKSSLVTEPCGIQALEAQTTARVGARRMLSYVLVTQSTTSSYAIQYMSSKANADPVVLAAMRAFCPK